jgi:parallel beta-helix repeat protein
VDPGGEPYIVQGDITVPSGAFLTIQAGTIVQFASTDGQASGLDAARVEVIIKGTFTVSGTAASPVQFKAQNGSAAATWYGLEIDALATSASITGAQIQHAVNGIYSNAPGSVLTTASTTIDTCTNGAYITDGTPTLDGLFESGSSVGFYFTGKGGGTLSNCTARGNSSDGIYVNASTGNIVVNVTNCSLHQNGSDGIEVYSQSGIYSATANIKNTHATQNASRGVYRNSSAGIVAVTTTYSNVWGNPTNYSGTAGGTGTFSANPLYVSNTNLRLTSNSPSRFSGDNGLDMGPLPYVNDPTPGLYGTLWVNTTLGIAGSPYTIGGDLTVGAGATLTIDPGVTLNFATTDIMAAYNDTSRSELNVSGVLLANGTAGSPITFTGVGAGASAWYGITFNAAATGSSLTNAIINETVNGVWTQSTGTNTLDHINVSTTTNGFYITDGSPTLSNCFVSAGSVGFYVTGKGTPTLSKCIARGNTSDGVYVNSSTGNIVVTMDGCSLHQNGSDGIEVYSQSGIYSATPTSRTPTRRRTPPAASTATPAPASSP